ncbi:MAG: glycoside hydrolase family 5 protein [Deltaproteobacteria bacterium]|nr:glycoside hydrolase family 5 protein [Deltaproteobacteria bacterium]
MKKNIGIVFLWAMMISSCQNADTEANTDTPEGRDSETSSSEITVDSASNQEGAGDDTDASSDLGTDVGVYIPDTQLDTDNQKDTGISYDTEVDTAASFEMNLSGLPLVGVSMSGPEWDGGAAANTWPNQYLTKGYASYLKWFREWGMTTVRLPFKWEYLEPELGGEFDASELEELKITVFSLRTYRAKIIIDLHNYARYDGDLIGSSDVPVAAFADTWRRLAEIFKPYPEVMFGIMNEPHDMDTAQWVTAANAAISAIRDTGAKNLIFVNANGWSGAHSWYDTWTDASKATTNAAAMLNIVDPLGDGHIIFEVHQYLNETSSDWGMCECSEIEAAAATGEAHPVACTDDTVGSYRMYRFTQWLRENNRLGFLGEFGVLDDATCTAALDDMLNFIEANDDVFVGWTWWSAGPGCASWQAPIDPQCWTDDVVADVEQNGVGAVSLPAQAKTLMTHLDRY